MVLEEEETDESDRESTRDLVFNESNMPIFNCFLNGFEDDKSMRTVKEWRKSLLRMHSYPRCEKLF